MRFVQLFVITVLALILTTILEVRSGGIAFAAETPNIQARVYLDTKAQYLEFKKMHLDEVWQGKDYIEIITDQQELDRLASLGFKTEIIISQVSEYYRSRLPKTKDMGGYKTLDEVYAYLDAIVAAYPGIVSAKVNIGSTIEGRPMWAVKISDNPNVDEDEPEVLYTAAIHAREVVTPEILFYFMDYLTNNYGVIPEVTNLVDNRELWFVVIVNPDGYYYNQVTDPSGGGMWRKNRRNSGDGNFGVDLNRNYGYQWGYDDLGSSPNTWSETYRGTGSFSEPETQHMQDFITAHNFVITMYHHSYSNLILYPWGYDQIYTPDNAIFVALADSVAALNGYAPGPGWGLYVTNGDSDDWGYGEQTTKNKNFSMTIESGSQTDGFWPTIHRKTEIVQEDLQPNLFLARIAGNIYQVKPPDAPVMTTPDYVDRLSYDVTWSLDDTLNPGILYELVEYQNKTRFLDSVNNWNNWTTDRFNLTTGRSHSATTSFFSGAENNAVHYIQAKDPINVLAGDSLKFWTYYDIEADYDYGYAEVSIDGTIFTPIAGNVTTDYNPYGSNRGNGITGASGGWVEGKFDLSAYIGQDIFIRFSYYTDAYTTNEGFYVDDIYPVEAFGAVNTISSVIPDTFYHFDNRPEGVYYYKARAMDAQNQWGQFSTLELVHVGTGGPFICGDASGNGVVNALDVTFIINFLYKDGPPPNPTAAADVNHSGTVNALDVTYLINFLYKGGVAPNCP